MSTETVEPSQAQEVTIDHVWHLKAACRGPHQQIFYPPTRFERRLDKRRREARAKEICRSCSVVEICRQQAIERRESYGIWGGLTEHERRVQAERGLRSI